MLRATATALTVCAVALAGCGAAHAAAPTARHWSEPALARALQLRTNDGGISYTHVPSGCNIAVVLNSPAEVETYASAGDNVVANPSDTAGVKIADRRVTYCRATMLRALRRLP